MNEMIERVAMAIAAADEPHEPWENWADRHKETFRAEARAAIKAMREPTDAMTLAGSEFVYEAWGDGLTIAREAWQANIDAALAQKS